MSITLFLPQHNIELPTELQLEIAYHLRKDKSTLQSLALASKQWLSPTYRVLFETLTLRSMIPVENQDDIFNDSANSFQDLLTQLRHCKYIPNHVRCLQLEGPTKLQQSMYAVEFMHLFKPYITACDIVDLLLELPYVNKLRIKGVQWIDCPNHTPPECCCTFPAKPFREI